MSQTAPWIIVGAGASGLAAAFALKQRGLESVIVERGASIGGRIGSVPLGDRSVDCGGKNIGRRYTLFRRFAASLGDHPFEPFGLNSSQAVDGRVRTLDGGSRWRSMANLLRGLSPADIVRFARVLWRVKRSETNGYLGSAFSRTLSDRFDPAPLSEYFSPAFCQRILRPMTVRMNGAEPDEVHMGTLPSNVRMILDSYEQFATGLAPVLASFRAAYDVRLNTTTEELIVEDGRVTGARVRYASGATGELRGAGVIVATPATAAAALTEAPLPALAAQLRAITYYPVTLVIAEYDRPIFPPATRAFVFGPTEMLSNAGAYGVNDLHVVRYTFSGRAFRAAGGDRLDPEWLLTLGEATLAQHVPVDAGARRRFVARQFNPGLCAYTAHHGRCLDRVEQERRALRGLYLTGDYVQGASIEACFRAADACAGRIVAEQFAAAPAAVVHAAWTPSAQTPHGAPVRTIA